jgi:hypothetical protein
MEVPDREEGGEPFIRRGDFTISGFEISSKLKKVRFFY